MIGWPTRVTNITSTTIDHIFSNVVDTSLACVIDNDISDHRTILFELYSESKSSTPQTFQFRRHFSDNSVTNFCSDLLEETWAEIYNLYTIDEAYQYFYDTFTFYFNKYFPIKKNYSKTNTANKTWVNNEIKISSRKLKDLYGLKNAYPELSVEYKRVKKEHINLVERTKKSFFQNKIINSANPSRAAWNVLSEISNKNNKINNIQVLEEGILHTDPNAVALAFNNYFINAPQKVTQNISTKKGYINSPNIAANINSMFLEPYDSVELLSLLKNKLKNKYSSGPDEIPMFLIKKVIDIIIDPITYLVNLSFITGTFPKNLKVGKVVPIYKKYNAQDMENYRPVSIPPGFSKLFEYSYLARLLQFIEKYGIITENQHGFRENRSTSTAMYSFYDKLIEHIEAGECPIGIFCDLSRAFDCVDHDILLEKLYLYGIRGVAYDWVASFLNDRKQYVSLTYSENETISKINSEFRAVNIGVPQGSVLGPILFILYTNDLENKTPSAFSVLYADDKSLLISDKSDDLLAYKCNAVLETICDWYGNNSLFLNKDKTKVIRFHNRQKECSKLNIKMNDFILNTDEQNKFLGITIDECLNWKAHCHNLISKLNSICYLFRNIKSIMTKEQLISIYHAQVGSRLRYGICIWGKSTLSPDVFIVQKRILRCIANVSSRESCRGLFKDFKILTLICLFIYELCVYVFKNKSKFMLTTDVHNIGTRQNNNFYVPFCKYNVSKDSPAFLGPNIFNKLPFEIKEVRNLKYFKIKLNKYLLDKCYYTLGEFYENF